MSLLSAVELGTRDGIATMHISALQADEEASFFANRNVGSNLSSRTSAVDQSLQSLFGYCNLEVSAPSRIKLAEKGYCCTVSDPIKKKCYCRPLFWSLIELLGSLITKAYKCASSTLSCMRHLLRSIKIRECTSYSRNCLDQIKSLKISIGTSCRRWRTKMH